MTGLKPLKRKSLKELFQGKTDYSHHKTFGATPVDQLPDEYLLVSTILDQGTTNECTAFASCAIQESQHGIQFDPQWFFEQEGVVNGSVSPDGYDMRVTMDTGVKIGFKPLAGGSPEYYKEGGYYSLIPGFFSSVDLFDSIRQAMWQAKDEKKCANLGVLWMNDWIPTTIIDSNTPRTSPLSLHAIKCAGWTTRSGIPYLVIQNSWGAGRGEGGLYLFSRDQINKWFREGAYIWRTPQEQVDIQRENAILVLLRQVLILISNLISQTPAPVPPVKPTEPVPVPPAPHPNIQIWALAIQGQEGGKPADRNMRNNNPGNMKLSDLTRSLGAAHADVDGFCMFDTYEQGFKALCDFLTLACQNQLKPYHDVSLKEFTRIYAEPPNDNYCNAVAKSLKVDPSVKISTLI